MTRKERQSLLNIIETAARCHACLTYFTQTNNQEQREAAQVHLAQLHGFLARSFEPFKGQIAEAILERQLDKVVDEVCAECVSTIDTIDRAVSKPIPRLGTVFGINLNNKEEFLAFLNSDDHPGVLESLLKIDYEEQEDREEEAIKEEIKRRLCGLSKERTPEDYHGQERERFIRGAVSMIEQLTEAIRFHGLYRKTDGKFYG